MQSAEISIKFIGATITALFTYLFGGVDMIFGLLIALITLDYITGFLAAVFEKNLSSEIGYKGIAKKVCILVIVAVSHLVGTYMGFDIRTWVIGYYIANEGISILENAARIGVPFPEKFLEILKQLKKDSDNK